MIVLLLLSLFQTVHNCITQTLSKKSRWIKGKSNRLSRPIYNTRVRSTVGVRSNWRQSSNTKSLTLYTVYLHIAYTLQKVYNSIYYRRTREPANMHARLHSHKTFYFLSQPYSQFSRRARCAVKIFKCISVLVCVCV